MNLPTKRVKRITKISFTDLTVKIDVLTVQVKVSSSVLMATLKYRLLLRR